MKTPKSQLLNNHWQKRLEPTKNDSLYPKTKKKPEWDGKRQYKQIPYPLSGGNRLENNSSKVPSLLWRFWTPCQAPQPGDLTKGLGIPRESGLECQQDLIIGFQRTEGNKDYSLGGHNQNFSHTKTQRRGAVTQQKIEPKLRAVLEDLLWRCGSAGDRTGSGVLEGLPWYKPSAS